MPGFLCLLAALSPEKHAEVLESIYIGLLSNVLHSAREQIFRQAILCRSPWKPEVPEMTEANKQENGKSSLPHTFLSATEV